MHETVIHVFWERVNSTPERAAILHKVDGRFQTVSWKESGDIVGSVGGALLSMGVTGGDKIAIMSASRARWLWSDIGNLSVGGVTVPIYPSLSAPEVEYLVNHSDAVGIFVENARQLRKFHTFASIPAHLKFVVLFEGETESPPPGLEVLTWAQFLARGREFLDSNPDAVKSRVANLKSSDLATIVYTSGTTGVPKGVMIPHSNIQFVCRTLSENVGFCSEDVALSFLPLSHIFERIGGQFLCIHDGILIAFSETMESVAENMGEVRPTIMNAVPRFYEKAYNRIQSQIRTMPAPQQYLIRWAISIGKRALKTHEGERNNGKTDIGSRIYRTELRVADRIVFSKIRQRFGGRLRFLVSGAAPLSPEVHQFFAILGLPILEGYGLTETTAPVCCNKPEDNVRGSVGKPLPGVEVKIASDGEILVRGPNVFSGYYKNDDATREAIRDGWFLTGDIGDIDASGYVRIKDRKKDIIITAGGKHVAPQVIENMLAGQGLVSRIVVYGDRRKHVVALVTPNLDEIKNFAAANGLPDCSIEDLVGHPAVIADVQTLINVANARLASFEQIKRFVILPHDFTIEANELTPTLKIRRKFVSEKYRELLDGLYSLEDIAVEKGLVS
ncbi:MAG: long-chain fatty acid--CoA ligase [Candidatus Obscuribacterales bacterium]|nr:long-chain fatty acid--CoA ligase [Candidatus Obscuribacterales bacterium]